MPLVHLVAHLRGDLDFLVDEPVAVWLWARLQARFPFAVCAQLLPNHLHLLTDADEPEVARRALARTCGHLGRRFGLGPAFQPLPPAEVVPAKKAPRVARYVDLNAVRAGLVASPLQWAWTTLRDLVGAVVNPWIDSRLHQSAIRSRGIDPVRSWLDYVLADDTVRDRRPVAAPSPSSPTAPAFGLEPLARACLAACRATGSELPQAGPVRRLFAALCFDQGARNTQAIAQRCSTSQRTIQRALRQPPETGALEAARQCLGDPRLRSPLIRSSGLPTRGLVPESGQRRRRGCRAGRRLRGLGHLMASDRRPERQVLPLNQADAGVAGTVLGAEASSPGVSRGRR